MKLKLTSFNAYRKILLKSTTICLLLTTASYSSLTFSESLTYSPDQWPRRWGMLMNKTKLQNRLTGYNRYSNKISSAPLRSPVWGVVPAARQKPRRTLRPEYNTNAHMENYYGQNFYSGNYYSGFGGVGLANPYNSPLLVPGVLPGLIAPGIPYAGYPYPGVSPFYGGLPVMGGFPGARYLW